MERHTQGSLTGYGTYTASATVNFWPFAGNLPETKVVSDTFQFSGPPPPPPPPPAVVEGSGELPRIPKWETIAAQPSPRPSFASCFRGDRGDLLLPGGGLIEFPARGPRAGRRGCLGHLAKRAISIWVPATACRRLGAGPVPDDDYASAGLKLGNHPRSIP